MEIDLAMTLLKDIERHANASKFTGTYRKAGDYLEGVFFRIANEARQRQWIDEDTYLVITTVKSERPISGLSEVGCASTLLMKCISKQYRR